MGPGIYIHIPYCVSKCYYCSFNSYVVDLPESRRYLDALSAEIHLHSPDGPPGTLYVGGGTPTSVEPEGLAAVIADVAREFGLAPGAEITLEANPGTLAGYAVESLVREGVNRVSLGAQSFDDAELRMLGRAHSVSDIQDSVNLLRLSGVDNINIDLMYSLPGQDLASWSRSMASALELGPEHVSLYCLSVDDGTPLQAQVGSKELCLPPESMQAEMYHLAVEALESAGLFRYEISNFAVPGRVCRHNMNYWNAGDYIGLGAGAHSTVRGTRTVNIAKPGAYIEAVASGQSPVWEFEIITQDDARREYIMLSLRTAKGLSFGEYASRFGHSFMDAYADETARLARAGCLAVGPGGVRLTGGGFFASNAVISEFF